MDRAASSGTCEGFPMAARHRVLTVAAVGLSALAGAGVFAWQAVGTDLISVEATGAVLQTEGCLDGGVLIELDEAVLNRGNGKWGMPGATITHTSAGAEDCEGKRIILQALDSNGAVIAQGSLKNFMTANSNGNSAGNGNFRSVLKFMNRLGNPAHADTIDVDRYAIIVSDSEPPPPGQPQW